MTRLRGRQLVSHILHLLGETVLGLLGVVVLGACLLAWRLAQGPIDITWLVHREQARLAGPAGRITVGHAALGWSGFTGPGAVLVVRVEGLTVGGQAGQARLDSAQASLSVPRLLAGQVALASLAIDGADIRMRLGQASGPKSAPPDSLAPPGQIADLRRASLRHVRLTLADALPGMDVLVDAASVELTRAKAGGLDGSAQLTVSAGGAAATLVAQATAQAGTTRIGVQASPLSPASLAGLSPRLAGLAGIAMPLRLAGEATLSPAFDLQAARLDAVAGPGSVRVGRGTIAVSGLTATLSGSPGEARLDALRIALAPIAAGAHARSPVITGTAVARRAGGRAHATFTMAVDSLAMADLAQYFPPGISDARSWLTQNVTAGRAHDAHIAGSLDAASDLSGLQLTGLTGGLLADDLSITWLQPMPGLTHASGRLVLESPDALTVTLQSGGQARLVLTPGSSIRITGLAGKDQFGDIDVGLSGPLPDALAILDHPRLHLLTRGGLQVVGARGSVRARVTLHVPMEDRVTMDQIPVSADATLAHVHLGRIAAGRDIDDGQLKLHVTGDGLQAGGTASIATIPARLSLAMDFRGGPPGQMLQHIVADGSATPAQLARAGLPQGAVGLMTGGQAGLHVDYASLRGGDAALQLQADLSRAGIATPLGWTKPAGPRLEIGGKLLLDHGRIAGVDNLHATGPGLLIASRTQLTGRTRALLLDRLEIGRTNAHGRIDFPAAPAAPVQLTLSGPLLDLSAQLDGPKDAAPKPTPSAANRAAADKPSQAPSAQAPSSQAPSSQAWAMKLAFAQVRLARGKVMAPLRVEAASDGRRILRAHASAGAPGQLAADLTPAPGGRTLVVTAADAGAALRALGVADTLSGGRLRIDGRFDDRHPGNRLAGTATLDMFALLSAPATIGRLMQAMTLYGVADLMRGPGLHFSRLVAPFAWQNQVLTLNSARAFSASLGITAKGRLDLSRRVADITGTVVPAYFFNQLLGKLPLIGKLFSPEKGGGLFAMRYSVRGPLDDPKVGVNPLSALTPGFLREGFGLLRP